MIWKKELKNNRLAYELLNNNSLIARMVFDTNKSYYEATCIVGDFLYTIERNGFWKTRIQLKEENGRVAGTVIQERIHSRKWRINILNRTYYIHYHNNPLFELVIYDENYSYLITYKLCVDDDNYGADVEVHNVTVTNQEKNLLLMLGWYLFMPIAQENVIDYALINSTL